MSAAGVTPLPTGADARGVLRLAWGILRRHAPTFVALALALAVAPALVLHTFTDAARRAIYPSVHTPAADLTAFAVYAAYLGGSALTHVLGFVGEIILVLVGLEEHRAPGRPIRQAGAIILRFLPVSLATWIAAQLLFGWLPSPASLVAYAVIACWTVVIPVYAAEKIPIRRLIGRSRAVFAGGGWLIAAVLATYCAGEICINAAYIHLDDIFGRSGAANWAGRTAVLSAGAGFATAVAVAVIALYRELRRVERATPSSEVVEAFR